MYQQSGILTFAKTELTLLLGSAIKAHEQSHHPFWSKGCGVLFYEMYGEIFERIS